MFCREYTSRCITLAVYSICLIGTVLSNEDIKFSANITLTDCQCTCSPAPSIPTTVTTAAPTVKTTTYWPFEEDEQVSADSDEQPKVMIKDEPFVISVPQLSREDDEDDTEHYNEEPGSGHWDESEYPSTSSPPVVRVKKYTKLLDTPQPTLTTMLKSPPVTTPQPVTTSLPHEGEIYLPEPGPKGEKGEPGTAGAAGPQGPAGQPGDKGEKGDSGHKGEFGLKGDKGDRGQPGQRGYPGTMGPQGYRGGEGPRGEAGTPGSRGKEGPRGPRGEQGTIGRKGSQGPPGPIGNSGPPGIPGKDAEVVQRQKVDFNLGKGYDSSSGSFLVTVDGLYVFHLQAMAMADHIAWVAIHVNGDPVAYVWASGYQSGVEQMGSTMTLQELKLGDVVNVVQKASENPQNYLYAHYTLFSGYLLG